MATPVIKIRFETEDDDEALRSTQAMRQAMVDAARAANDLQRAYSQAASGGGMRQAAVAAEQSARATSAAAQSAAVFEAAIIRQERAIATAERQVVAFAAAVQRSNVGQQEQARLIQAAQSQYQTYAAAIQRAGGNQLAAATATNQFRGATQRLGVELSNLKFQEHAAHANRFNQMAASGGRAFGGYGLALQQVGFQAADVAVQLQAGTNAIQVLTQQGSQLLGFFGPMGAILGAVAAVIGAVATTLLSMKGEAAVAAEATEELNEALKESEKAAIRSTLAEVQLTEAVERARVSTGDLTEMSYQRVRALQEQQTAALETAKAEVAAAQARVVAAQADAAVQRIMAQAAGGDPGDVTTPGLRKAEADLERVQRAMDALEDSAPRIGTAVVAAFSRDVLGPIEHAIEFQQKLAAAYGESEAAVRKVRVEEAIYQEQQKAGVTAASKEGQAIAAQVRQREALVAANENSAKASADAAAEARRQAQEEKRLGEQRKETIAGLVEEAGHQRDLRVAHTQGAEAVAAVTDAREAELIIQKLKLDQNSIEAGQIRELVERKNEEVRAIEAITDAQKEAERAAENLARKQERAAKEALRAYEKVIDDIREVSQEKLGDALFDHLRGETLDFGEFLKDTLLRAIADIAAAALTQQIVIPIAVQAVGAAPGLFGLSGQAAGVAQSAGGGLFGGGFNPLSSISNILTGGPGSLASSFALSGIGQALGLSSIVGPATALGVAAVPGGLSAAAGGALGGVASLTGAGSALVAAAPYLGIAAAALPILLGAFGRKPSVGPTGVARIPNVLGTSEIVGSTDNGGDASAAKSVAQSIRDISTSAADTLGAFGQRAFGLDIGHFPSPESGNSQAAGFNLKEIIDNVLARSDTFKGLTADEAITEGVRLTLQKGFDGFPVDEVSTALSKSSAKTIQELLSDLDLANAIGTFADGGREALLELTRPLTAVEQAFKDLAKAAQEGTQRAQELGLSVGDATAYFEDLREQLVESAAADRQARLNQLSGLGGINTINALLDQREVDIANIIAAAGNNATGVTQLGPVVDTSEADKLFDLGLRNALSGASLGDLGALLTSGQITDDAARSVVELLLHEQALTVARDLQTAAIQAEAASMQALVSEHERFAAAANDNARALRQAADELRVDRDLSPLSPLERVNEAARQFNEALALANDNDPTDAESQAAISRLPSLAQADLQANRDYYASSTAYQERFNQIQAALGDTALRQESIEQQQLSALRDIEAAIQGLGSTPAGTAAQQAAAGGFNFGSDVSTNQQIFNALMAAGLPTPSAFGGGQLNALRAANPAVDALVSALGFAGGGSFTVGGPAGNDNLMMPPVRVTAGEVVNVSRGDHMGDLLDEVRALRRENAENARLIAQMTAGGSLRVAGAVQEGNATTKRMASATERNAARPAAA